MALRVSIHKMLTRVALILCIFLWIVSNLEALEPITEKDVHDLVKKWSAQIGQELHKLSLGMTRKEKVTESFSSLKDKIYTDDGDTLIEDIASQMRMLMDKKVIAVKRIAEYAELLAYHRETETIQSDDNFHYYNADKITKTTQNAIREEQLQDEIRDAECEWWCSQKDKDDLFDNDFNKVTAAKLFELKNRDDIGGKECDCENPPDRRRPAEWFEWLPMTYDPLYGNPVNKDVSVVKVVTNVWEKDQNVLQGVRWTEPLDLIFKENLAFDPTLKYQYFTSPVGYMRHFPGVQWSQERYHKTYDPRTRSWYTEAMTSPKDVVILLDRSGSMKGKNRKYSEFIVNNILDTLNDNDFVNIYTFTNTTEPLVSCFEDILVPANEENLRLLRESLSIYELEFAADITLGLNKAFEILQIFRNNGQSSQCNQAVMLITEGIDYDYEPQLFDNWNWKYDTPVRIFTYQLGTFDQDARTMEWIACGNRGYYANISYMMEVREKVLNYINVMSRPINFHFKQKQSPIWSYLQIDLADRRYSNWLWKKFEGMRQREVLLDHAKREFQRLERQFTSSNHMLLQLNHEYANYQTVNSYDYMTTVSLPVYGRRSEDIELIGVAAVDVPIKLLYSLIPHHTLGVNGYAFILTNNGYVLMHPRHRREFRNIPKPTFNRVDFLEVEMLDDESEPRLLDESIIELRKKIVQREKGSTVFKVKTAIDDMAQRLPMLRHRVPKQWIGFYPGTRQNTEYTESFAIKVCERVRRTKIKAIEAHGSCTTHNTMMLVTALLLQQPQVFESLSLFRLFLSLYSGISTKRVLRSNRRYYYTAVGPFSLCIALPDKYGLSIVNNSQVTWDYGRGLLQTKNWRVHPDWIYCKDADYDKTPEENVLKCLKLRNKSRPLFASLLFDAFVTKWFEDAIDDEAHFVQKHFVRNVFLATHSGLTRWRSFEGSTDEESDDDKENFGKKTQKAIDEDWYKRAAEENYKEEDVFIYSVPWEISGYENNTMITSTNAIFVKDSDKKTPIAVVGLNFNHRAMYELYNTITTKCDRPHCEVTCESDYLTCFILDNNAYVVLADEIEYTGRYIGDIRPDIMHHLIENNVYKATQVLDYQAICQKPIPERPYYGSAATNYHLPIWRNFVQISKWAWAYVMMMIDSVLGGPNYQSIRNETLAYEKLELKKTYPTPCDHEMWLFTLGENFSSSVLYSNRTSKFDCPWPYVVERIPKSNLLFMSINNMCKLDTTNAYRKSPTPIEKTYNDSLPCYIALKNKYERRIYMSCYKVDPREEDLNVNNHAFCGHTWK